VIRNRFRGAPATGWLLGAILVGYAFEVLTGSWNSPGDLAMRLAIYPPAIQLGEYWRLLTAIFLHGGLLHLFVNLFSLFQIGTLYEVMFGTRRFLVVYFATGLVASITSYVHLLHTFPDEASLGASGALFGILGAFVFSVRRSPRWRHERAARNLVGQCVFWIVANLVILSQVPQIDNAAHIGGCLAGLILGAALPHRVPPPPPATTVVDVTPYESPSAPPQHEP
jgi:rhomboid protease GluP